MKREIEEEEEGAKEVPVSLSVPSDAIGSSQSATDSSKYFEPQESPVGVVSTKCTPVEVGDNEEKAVPSLDGLSCSPSTFHPSPTPSTSVIIPGTFTQKSSKEKVNGYIQSVYNIGNACSIGCESNIQLL